MGRHFASFVHVMGDDGQYHIFGPDDDIPKWAADAVGDHVWADDESDQDGGGEPPRSGPGSGKTAWAAFAADHDVEVSDDDSRDDIVAKLADAGVVEA